jgi:hypothetical protein
MKNKFFSNGQYVKLAMRMRHTLSSMMSGTEARAVVVRTCRNIRLDREWTDLKRKGLAV